MKRKILVAMLLVCAMSSAVVFGVFAQVAVLGVKEGDNFTYSFDAFWSSTNPSKIVPPEFSDLNQTLSISMNVTDVVIINVTGVPVATAYVNITRVMMGGAQAAEPGYITLSTGIGTSNVQLFIIGANLTAGQEAYPDGEPPASPGSFTITETVSMTYLGTLRDVNHFHSNQTITDGSLVKDVYYDKATGVLLEMTLQRSLTMNVGEVDTDSEHWKITQFSEAAAPPNGTDDHGTDGTDSTIALPEWALYAAVATVVVVVAALIAVVMLRRRKKPEVQANTTIPVQPQTPV